MRILVTGFTKLQVDGVKKAQIQKIDVPRQIVDTLRQLGHWVDWRRSGFSLQTDSVGRPHADLVWVNVAPCLSLNAPYALEGLHAIGHAIEQQIPLVLFFDDWQVRGTRSHARSFPRLQAAKNQLGKVIGGSNLYASDLEQAAARLDTILLGARALAEGHPVARVAVPMYAYGKRSIVLSTVLNGYHLERFESLDPTPFIQLIQTAPDGLIPARRHTLAALMDHKEWSEKLHLTWPIEYLGNRKIGAYRAKTELEVQERCNLNWGVLSPPYPQAGSGWWRSRYLYAAHLKRILISDLKDAALLGGPYVEATNVRTVEAYNDTSLRELAEVQSKQFFRCVGSRTLWTETLRRLVAS